MSDSSKRRGTDYETLRSMGAAGGHPPRDAEDPLAELARLVSQSAPHNNQDFGDDLDAGYAPPPAPPAPLRVAPPRSAYIPPPVDPMPDRLDPLGFEDDHPPPATHQRSYGAPMPATYSQDIDFFADEPLRGATGGYSDLDRGFDAGVQPRGYADEFDAGEDGLLYPDAADAAGDAAPARRGRGRMSVFGMGALMSAGLVAVLGAWAYMSLGGDGDAPEQPPVIAAPEKPVKVVAEAKPLDRNSKIYEDRITPATEANVGPGPEEPIEKPRPMVAESVPVPEAAEPSQTAEVDDRPGPSGARVVRTIPISPESMSASSPAAAEAPATIEGTGVAEGMSLERSQQFGILEPEAPAEESPQPSASAFAEEVPLPQPRPALATPQAPQQTGSTSGSQPRAAAEAPSPGVSGPPSSPQSQVTVTTRRPLQPQSAPPPVRRPQNSAVPANSPPAPPQAQPQRPVQIAAASAVPSRAQVATIASASSGAFGVQLTAQRSEQEAVAAFNTIKQRHPQVLGPYSPVVARADLGPDRGVFYRAMVPAQSQSDASNLCIQFKAAGVDCIVQRR